MFQDSFNWNFWTENGGGRNRKFSVLFQSHEPNILRKLQSWPEFSENCAHQLPKTPVDSEVVQTKLINPSSTEPTSCTSEYCRSLPKFFRLPKHSIIRYNPNLLREILWKLYWPIFENTLRYDTFCGGWIWPSTIMLLTLNLPVTYARILWILLAGTYSARPNLFTSEES